MAKTVAPKKAINPIIARLKKDKALADLIVTTEIMKDEFLNVNCVSLNLVFSGKIIGGLKKGKITTIAADSQLGKSLIGYNALQAAYKAGMACFVVDSEHAFNWRLAQSLGIDLDNIIVFDESRISEVKRIFARINAGLKREERRNMFVDLDSWGALVSTFVQEKAAEGSDSADMGRTAQFKNELANLINSYGNTTFVVNHVYASMQMYGEKFEIPGGKRLFFDADSIGLGSSAAKYKDAKGNILGKVVTIAVKKGRGAKEFIKTKYLIRHDGGIDPFFGLMDEAMESKAVFKPKPGYYARNFKVVNRNGEDVSDIDFETGEVKKMWTEAELYCGKFWVPIYKHKPFIDFVENKFSFINTVLISAQHNVMNQINGTEEWSDTDVSAIKDEDIDEAEQQFDFNAVGINMKHTAEEIAEAKAEEGTLTEQEIDDAEAEANA